MQVLNLHSTLSGADSFTGQARKFIRINAERFAKAYQKAIAWVDDFEHEYEELTVTRGQSGAVAQWTFAGGEESDAYKAFDKHLRESTYEVEPYAMTEAILDDINGFNRLGEAILRQLTTEFIRKMEEEAEQNESEEETDDV